ncbi:MAG: alcohol dehydrogenase catalytic domain-containing protein [Chloroflexi bacterium]|nr:alcohol dehydrogenase catalytic domain-containing protein [Chloroflexota bacterium]
MRALVKYAPGEGHVEIRDMPVRQPEDDELLIKVKYCGICGTDLHIYADEFPNTPPIIMGHEYCGTVEKVGRAVAGEWTVGERVVGELHTGACGVCHLCRAGKPHICDQKLALGSKYHGAFAEYLTIPAWLAHHLPEGIPWEVAGVTEPFAITTHCLVERGALGAEETVLITGSATMGLMSTIWVSRLGIPNLVVAGTDMDEALRFPLARELGATHVVNVQKEDLAGVVMEVSEGRGADAWIECSGSPAAIRSGLRLVKKTGKAVLIGLVGPETIPIPWNDLLYKELDLVGCFSSPPSSWQKALAVEREEAPKLRKLVTRIIPLDNWEEGFAMMRRGEAIKILVDMEA